MPNYSFEDYNQCPNGSRPLGIWNPIPWTDEPTFSSDYYHVCGTAMWQVPQNHTGYEIPQDSSAYIGIALYQLPNMWIFDYREYAHVQLTDTLKAGHKYCVTFYVSLADSVEYATSSISAYFSANPPSNILQNYFTYTPQISNPAGNYITNKSGWTKISGSFVANGNERFMTIGNFKNDSNTDTLFLGSNTSYYWASAYYYLDNVSVYELDSFLEVDDVTICLGDSTTIGGETSSNTIFSWSPNTALSNPNIPNPIAFPSTTTTYTLTQTQCDVVQTSTVTVTVRSDCDPSISFFIPSIIKGDEMLNIPGLEAGCRITVFDAMGKRVFISENYRNEFGAHLVAPGTYIVQLERVGGEIVKQKLVVVK